MGRVLVVEDNHAICALIAEVLEPVGLEAVCVPTDAAAYAALATLPTFRALIVDINLGRGTTGFDVARFAREHIPEIPVIYVSGEASKESFRAFGVPNSAFIAKPFQPAELVAEIRARLA